MPLPVIADVFRVTFEWLPADGISPRNVVHVRSASDDVTEIGGVINDAFAAITDFSPWTFLSNVFACDDLSILPLDGTSATAVVALADTMIGGATGELIPNMAAVLSFHTEQRGPRGRGRMYIGPTTENKNDSGIVDPTSATNTVTAWGEVIANLAASDPVVELGVASYVHHDFHPVTSHRLDRIMGTQRRRLDQLR